MELAERFLSNPRRVVIEFLIEGIGLTKTYRGGKRPAFAEASLQVCSGEILGVIGPNDSGKTTLMACLLGLLRPEAGWVRGRTCFRQSAGQRSSNATKLSYLSGRATPGSRSLQAQMRQHFPEKTSQPWSGHECP